MKHKQTLSDTGQVLARLNELAAQVVPQGDWLFSAEPAESGAERQPDASNVPDSSSHHKADSASTTAPFSDTVAATGSFPADPAATASRTASTSGLLPGEAHSQLVAANTVLAYQRGLEILLNEARKRRKTIKPVHLTYEFIATGTTRYAFDQAVAMYSAELGGASKNYSSMLIRDAVLIREHCGHLLEEIFHGRLPMNVLKTTLATLKKLPPVDPPPPNATTEEKEQYREDNAAMIAARTQLGRELAAKVATTDFSDELAERRFSKQARQLADQYHPLSPAQRHAAARKRRNVKVIPREDSMAEMRLFGPEAELLQIENLLEKIAATMVAQGQAGGRTRPQLLYDLTTLFIKLGLQSRLSDGEVNSDGESTQDREDEIAKALHAAASEESRSTNKDSARAADGLPATTTKLRGAGAVLKSSDTGTELEVGPTTSDAGRSDQQNGFGGEVENLLNTDQLLQDLDASQGTIPGVTTELTLLLDLDQFLELGDVVDPEMAKLLAKFDPKYGEICARNNQHFVARQKRRGSPPPWLETSPLQVSIRGMEEPLTGTAAAEFVATASKFSYMLCQPGTKFPLGHGRGSRALNPLEKYLVEFRDGTCRYPNCTKPASQSQKDHVLEWAADGGHTSYAATLSLCARHHAQKTAGWFKVRLRPEIGDGVAEFIFTHEIIEARMGADGPGAPGRRSPGVSPDPETNQMRRTNMYDKKETHDQESPIDLRAVLAGRKLGRRLPKSKRVLSKPANPLAPIAWDEHATELTSWAGDRVGADPDYGANSIFTRGDHRDPAA